MKAPAASLLNAAALIVMSGWAYLVAGSPSLTMLIPAAFGLALLACNPGLRAESKLIAHVAAALTLLILLALFAPMSGAVGRGDPLAMFRVGAMMLTSVYALALMVKSFIDARRARG